VWPSTPANRQTPFQAVLITFGFSLPLPCGVEAGERYSAGERHFLKSYALSFSM
jgi:hypothetical protein